MKKLILLLFLAFSFTISSAQTLNSFTISDPIDCFGESGELTASVSGGIYLHKLFFWNSSSSTPSWQEISPLTFSYLSSSTTFPITGQPLLFANSYKVVIYNPSTNIATDSSEVVLGQPNPLSLVVQTTTPVSCHGGSDGTAHDSIAGGTLPYSYLWSDNQTVNPAIGLSISSSGISCDITDVNGCTLTTNPSVSISQPANPVSVDISGNAIVDVSCYGESTGSITPFVTGGTGSYTYSWSPGGETTSSISNLAAGTYYVTVLDANSCASNPAIITAIIDEPTVLEIDATQSTNSMVSCFGGTDGSATVVALQNSGTAPYTYLWDDASGSTTSTITNLSAGTYTCTVTDAQGCTLDETVIITQSSSLLLSNISTLSNVSCFGLSDGSSTVQASGGAGSYTYLWSLTNNSPITQTQLFLRIFH